MEKFYLTPYQIEAIDPTGRGRTFLNAMRNSGAPTPTPKLWAYRSREEWLIRFQEWRTSTYERMGAKYAFERAFDEAHDCKYGGQGDPFTLLELQTKYEKSYAFAHRPIALDPMLYHARRFLLDIIRHIKSVQGGILYPVHRGSDGTLSGLPMMAKKGSFTAESAFKPGWRHVDPDLPGQRSQRLKHRGINVDAVSNVRYIERSLSAVRIWLKTHIPELFAAWLNPHQELNPRITKCVANPQQFATEIDYDNCDDTFSWEIAEFLLPIYEELLDGGDYLAFAACTEELFYQPIFWGTYLTIGKHNLLSGQAITNDFETLFDVLCMIAVVLEMEVPWSQIGLLTALGDDVLMFLPTTPEERTRPFDIYKRLAESAGMIVNRAKSNIREKAGECTFLRRAYSTRSPRVPRYGSAIFQDEILGVYPSVLVWNNTINPEKHVRSLAECAVQFCARCDNLIGSPIQSAFVAFAWASRNRKVNLPTYDELAAVKYSDWWLKVYGEEFSLKSSVTFHQLHSQHLL